MRSRTHGYGGGALPVISHVFLCFHCDVWCVFMWLLGLMVRGCLMASCRLRVPPARAQDILSQGQDPPPRGMYKNPNTGGAISQTDPQLHRCSPPQRTTMGFRIGSGSAIYSQISRL